MMRIVTLAAAILLPVAAWAQGPSVEVAAGRRQLDYSYRFENDSSFDTPFLVPHFFEQKYEVTGWEVTARARYHLFGRPAATAVSFAPERPAFGSDFDTFFQPDGDIATSGTAGGVDLVGFGIEQTLGLLELDRERLSLATRLAWRRDRADFHPADRVVTHTQPPSETREWTTDRETTVAQTFEAGIEGAWRSGGLTIGAHASPVINSRLLVLLPDKYPGRDIVFYAIGWGIGARATLARPLGPVTAGVWVSAEKAGSYRSSARYSRRAIAAGFSLGAR
jgi:hypothetical protein